MFVLDLKSFPLQISKQSDTGKLLKESKASKMLLKKVDSIINKLDKTLTEMEKNCEKIPVENFIQNDSTSASNKIESTKCESVRIDEVMSAIKKMQKVSDEAKLEQINKMLSKIDADQDGQLKVDDVLKVV